MTSPSLPPGFGLRPVSLDDAGTLADLVNDCMIAESGEPYTTAAQIRDDLTTPGRDPATDDALVVHDDGTPAGYLQLWADIPPYDELSAQVFTAPAYWRRGISTFLLRLSVERAIAKLPLSPPERRVVLQVVRYLDNERAGELFRAEGFEPVRIFRDMRIELDPPPPEPVIPEGIRIRTFDRERDLRPLHGAMIEAFEDHWGHAFPPLDQFVHLQIDGDGAGFDPSLWLLATDGDQVVGAAIGKAGTQDPHMGNVDTLAVRRAWRGRGVGLALLQAAFVALREAGFSRANLGVDAESPTGATRLYERGGMRVEREFEFWEKELRPARPSADGSP